MKNFKKIMALVVAMVMVLATMVIPVMAADGDPTGSITVHPSSTVALTNKNLNAYRILDATYSPATADLETGKTQAISYTIPAAMLNFYNTEFAGKIEGADKTATEMAAAAGKTVDQYVVDSIAALTTAQLKDFEYRALAAAKAANLQVYAGAVSGTDKKFSNLPAGYYVIEDVGTGKPLSVLMLDTVTDADVEINLKAEDKTEKKVKSSAELVQEKANELGLGRNVDYVITGEIPDYTGFDYMYYMVNDTLSAGLTFNPDSVVVKVTKPAVAAQPAVGNPGDPDYKEAVPAQDAVTTTLVKDTDYYLYYDNGAKADDAGYEANEATKTILNGKTFIIAFEDVVTSTKINIGDAVEVTYNATVNSDAITGINPNTNKVTIEYSNNPDKDHREDVQGKPGIPANKTEHPTGEGPEKDTDTYTTKIKILKVDGTTNEPLTGVEFTLTGTSRDVVYRTEQVFEIDPAGTYWLLKDGTYTTDTPQTAATVEETTGGAGWVEVGASETVADGVPVRVVGDKKYRPYVPSTDSALTRYTIVEPNTSDYASTTTKYAKKTVTTTSTDETVTDSYAVTRTGITAGADASVTFAQLGAGTYKLSETGVLAGYNEIPDIEFTVACTLPADTAVINGTETASWKVTPTTDGVTFQEGTGADAGTFVITLENNKGAELPSTGGIGTTIFYVIGAILVMGAGVLLVTRRRMNAN